MIVLGLDPGTAIVGWGVIDTGSSNDVSKAACLGYGCITTDKTLSDSKRLVAIAAGMEALLKEYKPALASVEKLFFTKNQTTAMTVSQARGLLLYKLEKHGIPMMEFTPTQVKQSMTGYGKAEKMQVQKMVQLVLHLPSLPKPDDAADALAIAVTAAQTKVY